jgi:uncharacterized protein YunC (DUF1805 family)
MAATDARPVPRKNTAWRVYFSIRKSDGTLVTSWTGADSEESLDGGSFTDCTNEATEIGTSGCGYLDLTAAEMNADAVMIKITVTNSGALPLVMTVFPEEAGDYRADTVQVGGVSQTGGDLAVLINTLDDYVDTEIAAIKAKTDNLPSDPADASDIATSFATVNTKLDTIDDFLDTEIAAIKAKTDNLPADPADASDIAASFVTVNSKLDAIDDYVDTEVAAIKVKTDLNPADHGSVLISGNSNREVLVTGSKHIAADVHEFQPDVIDADALATSAVTEIQSGLATAAALTTVEGKIDTIDNLIDTEIATLTTEVGKIPKQGETRRYTQVASNEGNKTADVSIGAPL